MKPNKKTIVLTAVITAVAMFIVTTLIYLTPVGKTIYFTFAEISGDSKYSKLYAIERIIEETYYEDLDHETMEEMALTGYVAGVGDAYTEYMPADYFDMVMSDMEDENYRGIGIETSAFGEKIGIMSVMDNSPAAKAGLLAGDCILAVNGKEYDYSKIDEAVSDIKSTPEGSMVKLTIERDGSVFDVDVETENIEVKNVTHKMIDSQIGYVRIRSFGEKVETDFMDAVQEMTDNNMEALVIDLRSNPGGYLDSVVDIVDFLVPEGTITTIKYKNAEDDIYTSDAKQLDVPMAVLINEDSASASEVMAGALKDFNKATLIGKKTYGKGVVQGMYELKDGSAVRVTIAKYYTPSNVCIDQIGIEPDVEVDLPQGKSIGSFDIDLENDTQFNKALEILRGEIAK